MPTWAIVLCSVAYGALFGCLSSISETLKRIEAALTEKDKK